MDLPSHVGRYTVLRALGQGGMGRVLLARDEVLGRLVALKLLRDDLAIPPELKKQLYDRMRQEARAAATLAHPNMVTLHDMGEEEGVGLYLVFEYIEGPTLRERLADGPLRPDEVATFARELGSALTHAHQAGVIHRDIKPENVMLAPSRASIPEGAAGKRTAKITDFGIARLPDSTLTRSGSVLGTPAYSAPESLASADFSPLSDQFALASTLYEALTGRRAFDGDDALVVATRVATESAPPIGAIAGVNVPQVERVLARGMAKDKARRWGSAVELGEMLANALEQPVARDTPPPRSSIVPRATRRWQNIVAGSAVLVIAVLVVLGRRATYTGLSLRAVADAFESAASSSSSAAPAVSATNGKAHDHGSAAPSAAGTAPHAADAGAGAGAADAGSTSTSTSADAASIDAVRDASATSATGATDASLPRAAESDAGVAAPRGDASS